MLPTPDQATTWCFHLYPLAAIALIASTAGTISVRRAMGCAAPCPMAPRGCARANQELYHFNGLSTFGERAVVPEDSLVLVREDAPLDKVALIGCGVPTGVGAAIHTAKVQPGSKVVVIGAGGVGPQCSSGRGLSRG